MRKSLWIAAAGLAGVLAATSCGGGSSTSASASEDAYVTALSKAISAENAFGGGAESADCLASGIVKTVGVKTLTESNIDPADFASTTNLNLSGVGEKKLDRIIDFLLSGKCVDVAKSLADSMRAQAGDSVTEDQATCVATKLVKEDSFRRGFRASLTGSSETASNDDAAVVRGLMTKCGVALGS